MGLKRILKDANNHQLKRGLYVNNSSSVYMTRPRMDVELGRSPEAIATIYHVYREKRKWQAQTSDGTTYQVDYPRGMPDSALMPEGKIDSATLVRVNEKDLPELLNNARGLISLIRNSTKGS